MWWWLPGNEACHELAEVCAAVVVKGKAAGRRAAVLERHVAHEPKECFQRVGLHACQAGRNPLLLFEKALQHVPDVLQHTRSAQRPLHLG